MTFKSGSESATLLREAKRELISYNGHASITVRKGPFITLEEVISGVIPALSTPRLDRALVLGYGTGITAGTVSRIFRHTDVVEINAAFYEMMPYLSYANLDIETNPNATLHLADGRSFLIGKENRYDAIVNAIPAPTYYSASKIYTLEFYERVKKALVSDGIFTTWLAVPNMSEEGLLAILSALHKTFRYCDLRLMSPAYYTTTCADHPIRERRFSDLPAHPKLLEVLRFGLRSFDPDEVFADIRLSENIFEYFTPVVPHENTDDHPVLEFMVVRNFQRKKMGREFFLEQQALLNIDPVRRDESEDGRRPALSQGRLLLPSRSVLLQAELRAADRARHHRRAAPLRAPLL
jgi:hypothetical protein